MALSLEMLRLLEADLGATYNPRKALEFLRGLHPGKHIPAEHRLMELTKNPPDHDVLVQTIYETPFVRGDIVIAGKTTRKLHPLTLSQPMHFRKTYLEKMSQWENPTSHEENQSNLVWKHFHDEGKHTQVPLPLGSSPQIFRSEILYAKSLGSISPVHNGPDPKELAEQIRCARKNFGGVATLWDGLESLRDIMETLHNGGMLHHDAHRENLMLAKNEHGAWEGKLIDFETTEEDPRFGTPEWPRALWNDCRFLIEEATLIRMCAQPGEIKQATTQLCKEISVFARSSPKIIAIREIFQKDRAKESGPGI